MKKNEVMIFLLILFNRYFINLIYTNSFNLFFMFFKCSFMGIRSFFYFLILQLASAVIISLSILILSSTYCSTFYQFSIIQRKFLFQLLYSFKVFSRVFLTVLSHLFYFHLNIWYKSGTVSLLSCLFSYLLNSITLFSVHFLYFVAQFLFMFSNFL